MIRMKTELEKSETPADEAKRLRHALFVIHGLNDTDEIKRIAKCAMAGELTGHEWNLPKIPEWWE
jgi:hypothetical protein